jgi:hypothetical protein
MSKHLTRRALKRLASSEAIKACVISDGCRDYVVEVLGASGAGLLRNRRGRVERFRNLGEVRQALRDCPLSSVVLRQRVAHDEAASGLSLADCGFSEMPLNASR